MRPILGIADYGVGNLKSVSNMLSRLGIENFISSRVAEFERATHLVLPGVGAFDAGVKNLKERGLDAFFRDAAARKDRPILGICLGMHLMMESSDEGTEAGLALFRGRCLRFDPEKIGEKVPHMGWADVSPTRPSEIWRGLETEARFYFAHSYHVVPDDPSVVLARADYGLGFVAAIQRGCVTGVQFHPEKSHRFGFTLLKNFSESAA